VAWTTPKTWNVGDILTAADMNTYVRDNTKWLLAITGSVHSGGTVLQGSGFSSVKNSTGVYTVTFSVAFAAAPMVLLTTNQAGAGRIIELGNPLPTTTAFVVNTWDSVTGSAQDAGFIFHARGFT
jgi:hypothetical protein